MATHQATGGGYADVPRFKAAVAGGNYHVPGCNRLRRVNADASEVKSEISESVVRITLAGPVAGPLTPSGIAASQAGQRLCELAVRVATESPACDNQALCSVSID
jgi:hypothetical protein